MSNIPECRIDGSRRIKVIIQIHPQRGAVAFKERFTKLLPLSYFWSLGLLRHNASLPCTARARQQSYTHMLICKTSKILQLTIKKSSFTTPVKIELTSYCTRCRDHRYPNRRQTAQILYATLVSSVTSTVLEASVSST